MEPQNIININGIDYSFTPGETILEIATRNDIYIPTLCYLKGMSPTGVCRICLVEVEGAKTLLASCSTQATPGMVVKTDTPAVIDARRMNIELLLSSGDHNCLARSLDADSWTDFQLNALDIEEHRDLCPAYGDCRLQDLAILYRVKPDHVVPANPKYDVEDVNPFIVRDFSRCILCGRCVQVCNEIQVNNVISFGYRGATSKIITRGDRALKDSDCVFCGECLQVCPVGALIPKQDTALRTPVNEMKKVRTTCSYCGVGCQIYLHVKDNRIERVTGVEGTSPNLGSLCVKGRFGYDFIAHPERLTTPLIKKDGEFHEATWDEALDLVAKRMNDIKRDFGPDSIGLFTSARITNEENYLAQKFIRAVIGTNNIDHCARL